MIVVYHCAIAVRTIMKILVHHVTNITAAVVHVTQDTMTWLQSECTVSIMFISFKYFSKLKRILNFSQHFFSGIGMVDRQDIKTHRLRRLHQNMNDHPHITTIRQALHLKTKCYANEKPNKSTNCFCSNEFRV